MAKSQAQRVADHRKKIKAERDALSVENAELRRQLAERTDRTASPSQFNDLSPSERAELERLIASGKLKRVLEWTAKKHAEEEAQKAAAPEVTPAPAPSKVQEEALQTDLESSQAQQKPDDDIDWKTLAAEIAASDYHHLPVPVPEIESEEVFHARLKDITDDPNKPLAQKRREIKAEIKARADRQREIKGVEELNRPSRHDQDFVCHLEFDVSDEVVDQPIVEET